ncbi:uncharacterized protein [Aristolochia californica]|uniref:uncharacterized protein isoform X1 n=1 Tax=Aristolochia californica TaxID=171875 RepID=UPI0035E047D4
MLSEVLCARPRPPGFASPVPVDERLSVSLRPTSPVGDQTRRRCSYGYLGGAALLWQAILPCGEFRREIFRARKAGTGVKEEGSWNAAWDARPARWLHCSDSEWLLFGICPYCGPLDCLPCHDHEEEKEDESSAPAQATNPSDSGIASSYRITDSARLVAKPCAMLVIAEPWSFCSLLYSKKAIGMLYVALNSNRATPCMTADGRCLFRAIAHGSCLRNGKEAPDETQEQELADGLRVQVADELLKRRKEIEKFIEGDFDEYVKNIQQPQSWGGEPELVVASHVLRMPITVFIKDKSSGSFEKIASYGQEYKKDGEMPVEVLFHGYGHYDLLESISCLNTEKK